MKNLFCRDQTISAWFTEYKFWNVVFRSGSVKISYSWLYDPFSSIPNSCFPSSNRLTWIKKRKHPLTADIRLLPVSHVNSNNTAWHFETPKKPRLDWGGASGSDFQRSAPPDSLTNILFARNLRVCTDLQRTTAPRDHQPSPSMSFVDHPPSFRKSKLCLPVSSASFRGKKKGEAKQAKVLWPREERGRHGWNGAVCVNKRRGWRKPSFTR